MSITIDHKSKNRDDSYRSPNAQFLHRLVCEYSLYCDTPEGAEAKLNEIRNCLDILVKTDSNALLEKSIHGYSHIGDAIHLPFLHKQTDPELQAAKANALTSLMIQKYRGALDKSRITGKQYADIYIQQDDYKANPLKDAIYFGSAELYTQISDEIKFLYSQQHMGKETFRDQFLQLSVKPSQNPELFKRVNKDVQAVRGRYLL